MKNHRFIIVLIVMSLTYAVPAYAYLDPGSGSIILQGILAAIAGSVAAIKLYWAKLKTFVRRCLGKPIKEQPIEEESKQEKAKKDTDDSNKE